MLQHALEHGIVTGRQSVGSVYQIVEVDDEKRIRVVVAAGEKHPIAIDGGSLKTLIAVCRVPASFREQTSAGGTITVASKKYDLVADGPLQLCAGRHHDERLAGDVRKVVCHNNTAVDVEFDVLVGWVNPTPAEAEEAAANTDDSAVVAESRSQGRKRKRAAAA